MVDWKQHEQLTVYKYWQHSLCNINYWITLLVSKIHKTSNIFLVSYKFPGSIYCHRSHKPLTLPKIVSVSAEYGMNLIFSFYHEWKWGKQVPTINKDSNFQQEDHIFHLYIAKTKALIHHYWLQAYNKVIEVGERCKQFGHLTADSHQQLIDISAVKKTKTIPIESTVVRFSYHKGIGSDNIKHRDSQNSLWIKDTSFLENFSCNWNCGVNRITNYVDNSFWATFSNCFTNSLNNSSIDVEEVIPCHPWFSRNTSGNDYKIHPYKSIL